MNSKVKTQDERIKILLAEDDLVDQMAFQRYLQENNINYDYHITSSLAETITELQRTAFDIVITDYNLGDGIALDFFPFAGSAIIIIATGEGTEEIAVNAMKQGAYDYLIKDRDRNYLKVLPITVNNAINYRRQQIESKRNLEDIKQSRNFFLSLFKGNPEPSVYLDSDHKIVDINPRFNQIFEYDLAEIKGKHIDSLIIPTENLEEAAELNVKLTEGYVYHDSERLTKSGHKIAVSISAAPILVDGKQIGSFVIYKDIRVRKKIEEEREKLILELRRALEEVKTLSDLIPICSHCKKVRDDKGYWTQVEDYLAKKADLNFSHGICPDCMALLYPGIYEKMKSKKEKSE
ncbi:MAG: PAS domain S-box protein [Candidatus Cloacimonetes bacterium]|nr:PAS domain S-box protein [Candidatus Cloacimonadota bacterium]